MLRTPIYNPGQLEPAELERIFVVRQAELTMLERGMGDYAADRARQHAYIIGRRGMGKTMLLLRLAHLCAQRSELEGLLPALLIEEQYGIGDLADFWIEIAMAAAAAIPTRASAEALTDTVHLLRDQHAGNAERLAEAVLAALKQQLRRLGKRLVILLDNFDDVLDAISDERAQHRLREELQENREILLFAASARAAEGTMRYDAAFYDFFRIYRLDPLPLAEVRKLLILDDDPAAEARVEQALERRPARLHGIYTLTGGNPRLVMLARRLFRDSPLGTVRGDLAQLLDDVTPYYKHLIEEIPRQGRRVFHALAGRWDPATAQDLEGVLRLPRNQVSAQLSRLQSEGWLEEVDALGRGKTYQLASRLFNLYYVMRFRRTERERLRYWVLFIEAFFGRGRGPEPPSESRQSADKAVQKEPKDPVCRHTLMDILLRLGEIDAALMGAKTWLELADETYLTNYGRDAINSAVTFVRQGRVADLASMLDDSPVPDFWAPVKVALEVRMTGDERNYAKCPQEIADSARDFLARVDAENDDEGSS